MCKHGIVNRLYAPCWLAYSIIIFSGENRLLILFSVKVKKLYLSKWKSLAIREENIFPISADIIYFKLSKSWLANNLQTSFSEMVGHLPYRRWVHTCH